MLKNDLAWIGALGSDVAPFGDQRLIARHGFKRGLDAVCLLAQLSLDAGDNVAADRKADRRREPICGKDVKPDQMGLEFAGEADSGFEDLASGLAVIELD